MNYNLIHTSLDNLLKTVSNLPKLQIENIRIKLSAGSTAWCRATLIPGINNIATIGKNGFTQINGLYQVDLFYPQHIAYTDTLAMADAILSKFEIGTMIGDIRITNAYIKAGSNAMTNYYQLPVVIAWEQHVQRSL